MKKIFVLTILLFSVLIGSAACKKSPFVKENQLIEEDMAENANPKTGNKLKITVGVKTFTAKLLDSPTAEAFKALLPLTLNMNELNNNEKYNNNKLIEKKSIRLYIMKKKMSLLKSNHHRNHTL